MIASFPRRHLLAVSHFAGQQDVRYYLNGVHVEVAADEVRLTATDGNAVAVMRFPCKNTEPIIVTIPNAAVAHACKSKSDLVTLVRIGDVWTIAGLQFTPVEGRFPDTRRVFSLAANPSGVAAQFNLDLLGRFGKAAKALQRRDSPIVRHNGEGAATVHFYACDNFMGLLMPYTEKRADLGVPNWAQSS